MSLRSLVLSRPLLLATALLALGAAAGPGCSGDTSANAATTDRDGVPSAASKPTFSKEGVAVAEVGTVPDLLVVTGTIAPLDRAELVPDITGRVVEVLVDRGATVAAGDPLVRLDTRHAELSVREARANLGALQAQQRLADDTCRKSKDLLEKGAITRAEYDRDAATCAQSRQSVAAASARVAMAGQTLTDGLIRAPFAGTIADRWISVGEWASPQGKLFTLVDDSVLRADLALSEAAAAHARLGAPVTLSPVADPSQVVHAVITRIGVEIDPKTRALTVEVALPRDAARAAFRPGMFVAARIAVGERQLTTVPTTALVKRGSTWRVFAVVEGRLEERVVQRGPDTEDGRATLVRGLAAGESYARTLAPTTTDGMRVQ